MVQNDEINSSLKNIDFITFVGFKRHLVLRFLEDNLKNYFPNNIYVFTSNMDEPLDENFRTKQEILLELEKLADRRQINIKKYFQNDLWNIKYYYKTLNSLPNKTRYIINISAGPSVFAAAGMLWALQHNYYVSYSVEHYEHRQLISCVFRNINMRSVSNLTFNTNNVDKFIIEALKNGMNNTNGIRLFLLKNYNYQTGLRNIQEHIKKLEELGLIRLSGNKGWEINFSDDLEALGYTVPSFLKR
ncbi:MULTISPECIES: hypothetical protein [Acidiplasma]|uniref:Uncharacterized protein n=2 Tax=Acidiplasma TaxID=507753 RepID=A0A0Q1B6H9_9ARCH|nr:MULTISPECIES: hypothetical protein [Acidiplasma]KJE50058.1 hypothetical protein TZ01_03115 [Acidiplasma sp. MBA-1]KPV46972.1 hypothetical protein SE19_03090 [Acidiplasma aeolicum]KQB35697.1 hypothetical protein AOG55_06110 [Acidiplasma cupricumulans]WMT55275.1 MAG: hypothetical protein RE470_01175 [Acidiplasma sp.]